MARNLQYCIDHTLADVLRIRDRQGCRRPPGDYVCVHIFPIHVWQHMYHGPVWKIRTCFVKKCGKWLARHVGESASHLSPDYSWVRIDHPIVPTSFQPDRTWEERDNSLALSPELIPTFNPNHVFKFRSQRVRNILQSCAGSWSERRIAIRYGCTSRSRL